MATAPVASPFPASVAAPAARRHHLPATRSPSAAREPPPTWGPAGAEERTRRGKEAERLRKEEVNRKIASRLRDRLSRFSAAAARSGANASPPSSSSASSPSSSWEESVAPSAHAPRRRERLGMLLQQEGRGSAALAALGVGRREEAPPEKEGERKVKKGNFWARLQQQQLHHGAWHRKDGCSLAHSRAAAAEKSAAVPPKRAPVV